MALPDVSFIRNQTSTGQPLAGADFISAIVFYNDDKPALFPSNVTDGGVKACLSLQDAENVGITNDYSDETAAEAEIEITDAGDAGDVIVVTVTEPYGDVELCSYTVKSTDTTATLLAASIANQINTNTVANGGYSATAATGTITITARAGLGIALNSGTPLSTSVTSGSTYADTITQFTGGVGSKLAIYHYHISEYFRIQPNGKIWVGIFDVPATFLGTEITTLQNFADGEVRQVAIYVDAHSFTTGDITKLETIANTNADNHKPLRIILAPNIQGTSDLSTLATLATLSSENVSVCIGQDGAAAGNLLFLAYGKSVTNVGAMIGVLSLIGVHQSIASVALGNISDGTENEVAAFANGNKFSSTSTALLNQLNNYRYIFVRKFTGYTGTFFNDEHTCILQNNPYAYISANRVADKIERLDYIAFLPFLSGNIKLNSDGTIFNPVVKSMESVGNTALDVMVSNNEVSGVETIISPTQLIKTSGTLEVSVNYILNYVARNIKVSINQVTSL